MSSSLSNLKPNHVPSQQFELAPGWFILLMIGLVTSLYFILFFIKKYQQNSYRRCALKKIKKIELRWKSSGSYDDIIQRWVYDPNNKDVRNNEAFYISERHETTI